MEQTGKETEYNCYHDISVRTKGEIYIGVVGPVRTGKSTFIKRFMDLMVLPYMENPEDKMRAEDELPQSAGGKTVTTTEPKFIPKEAATISLSQELKVKIRLVDCVGFMVDGAVGHLEDGAERMVKTPWDVNEIPFTKAAEIGTKKVIKDHSTMGIVVTTDGSIGELERSQYVKAEETTIEECKRLNKPFLILVNSTNPYGETAVSLAKELEIKYGVSALAVNCAQLKESNIRQILEKILYEFPVNSIELFMPKWLETLPNEDPRKADFIAQAKEIGTEVTKVKDVYGLNQHRNSEYIKGCRIDTIQMEDGTVKIELLVEDTHYYKLLSDLLHCPITGEYHLMEKLKELSILDGEYKKVLQALELARKAGYGVTIPERDEITLTEPEIVKHGNKYGVKIKAECPSIHLIRANILTEIAPIVGTEEQAKELLEYIRENASDKDGIWNTTIFGKTVEQMIFDGIQGKITNMGEESKQNLQESLQKIVNESSRGMIFILL
ncbi:MAG: stage IV sporulation protein A [Lachnospiraceae bacterium]|nr:stage IV sporulation protein A [Lachnospiraceae bacterium]